MADGDIHILESFDRYAESGTIGRMNSIWSSSQAFTAGRYFGGKATRFRSLSNGGTQVLAFTDARHHKFTLGCAVRPENRTNAYPLLSTSGPSGSLTIGMSENGRLTLVSGTYGGLGYSAGNLIGDGLKIDAVINSVWQYLEWQIEQEPGANTGNVKAWVNGELCLQLDAVTLNRSGGFDGFGMAVRDEYTAYDDLYMREGPVRLGEIKIQSVVPDNTVSNTFPTLVGAASAHAAVVENPVDGDTTYIAGTDVGQGVRFSMGDLIEVPDAVRAIQIRSFARKDETAYRSIKNVIKSAGVEASGKEHVLGTDYKYFRDVFQTDPATDLPWSNAAVDAFLAGIDIHA